MNDERITAYLLQELSEEEAERFEEECFAQEEWPGELDAVERELIDAYLRNELTKERQLRFKEKYLITDARKARVSTAQSFLEVLCPRPPHKKTLKDWLRAFFQRPLVPQAAAAILILAVAVPFLYNWLTPPAPTKIYSPLALNMAAPDRGSDTQMEKVFLPLNSDGLKVALKIPQPPPPNTTFRVVFENANAKPGKVTIESQNSQSVVVIIEADELSPGRYVLKLFKTPQGEAEQSVGSYFFKAEPTTAR